MGDGADLALDEMLDNEEDLLDFKTGRMSQAAAYEAGIIDELGEELESQICEESCPQGKKVRK